MTTSKRTPRGTGSRPDNGAATPSAPPQSAAPPKASPRQRKSSSSPSPSKPLPSNGSDANSSHTATTRAPHQPVDRDASIAQAAYFRSQHRGFTPGHEVEDWLAAEAEVDQRLRGAARSTGDSPG